MPNIEPLYIVVIIAVVVGAVWYIQRVKEKKDEIVRRQLEDKARNIVRDEFDDAVSRDEEAVPTLSRDDQDPQAALQPEPEAAPVSAPSEALVAVHSDEAVETEQTRENAPEPAPAAEPETVAAASETVAAERPSAPVAMRSAAEVDPAIEAVINITPREEVFDLTVLKRCIADVMAEPLLKGIVRVQCFDRVSGVWYDGAERVTECTQIYLTMLLANRTRCVDQPTASRFMVHAEHFAIELKGESETPYYNELVARADRIKRIVEAFDKRLSVKLVSAKDITEDELDAAAAGCGFEKQEDCYAKRVAGVQAPVFHIHRSETLGNEIELSFDVPLMLPASDPLAQFFAIANDLCCRLDAVMTDASGNPIGARAASRIAAALKTVHTTMSEHGVAAGSRRCRLIFSMY